jgi:hypothetical protein
MVAVDMNKQNVYFISLCFISFMCLKPLSSSLISLPLSLSSVFLSHPFELRTEKKYISYARYYVISRFCHLY